MILKQHGGILDIAHLWINLPSKMAPLARYQGINKEDIPVISLDNGLVKLNIISGEMEGIKGPVESITDIDMATIEMKTNGKYKTKVELDRNILFYILSGDLIVNGKEANGRAMIIFGNDNAEIEIEAKTDARITPWIRYSLS